MNRRLRDTATAAVIFAAVISPVLAAETIRYGYDARGRLIQVNRTEGVSNGVVTNYSLDKADNRTGKSTSGSPNPPPP